MSSSSPEDSCIKFDAFGHVVKKPVEEAMATKASVIDEFTSLFENLSAPEDYLQYVINGIHELTGFNWWISIVLTAFLVNGLMSPINLLIQRQIWELRILVRCIQKVNRVMKTCDTKSLAKYKRCEEKWIEKFQDCSLSFMPLASLHIAITISFINGISVMSKTTPEFANGGLLLFTSLDSFYVFPLLTGLTFWLTREI